MITAIIHKEFISTLRDGRLLMLGLSVFLLLVGFFFSLYTRIANFTR